MATARPLLFTAISGKMGTVEFAQRGPTTIIRNAKKPKTKVTWRIIEAQRIHAYKISVWKSFTTDHPLWVTRWNQYAISHPLKNRIGQTTTISGFQYFMKLFHPCPEGLNHTSYPPYKYPKTRDPVTYWATITAPSTFIVYADFNYHEWFKILKRIKYSDPLPPSGITPPKLQHHQLINDYCIENTEHERDYSTLCAQRDITFTPGDQIIVTLTAIYDWHETSIPYPLTITVAAP